MTQNKYPFYFRATMILLGLSLFITMIVVLREILVPLSLALVLAILLNPLVNRFQRWKFPRVVAIVSSLMISLFALAVIAYFITMQVASFSDQLPVLKQQTAKSFNKLQNVVAQKMNVTRAQQHDMVEKVKSNMEPMATHALGTVFGSLAMVVLLPVYTFLLLFYKTLILNFLYELFERDK